MFSDISFDFHGKNFVVVGASSGIGRQTALDLAKAGANVLAVARNAERLSEVKSHFPDNITTAVLDVSTANKDDWNDIISPFTQKYGKCHGGVYTAGIGGVTSIRSFDKYKAENIFDVDFWGMINFIQTFVKKKFVHNASSFVVISSVASYDGLKGNFAYSAAKSAVRISVKSIAKELCRDGHRINSVSPGVVDTPLAKDIIQSDNLINTAAQNLFNCHRLGIGKTNDISGTVLFLLSEAARWITGTDIVVDGGFLLGID